jgi:hypothetical protein
MSKNIFVQTDLFGSSIIHTRPNRTPISEIERTRIKEKSEAHRAWKLLKSGKFKDFSDRHKFLLKKYYGIEL